MLKQVNKLAANWPETMHLKVSPGMRRLVRTCTDAAFPLRCRKCNRMYYQGPSEPVGGNAGVVADPSKARDLLADHLCPQCLALFAALKGPLCSRCGKPFKSRHGVDHPCPDCLAEPFDFDAARAAAPFDPAMKAIVYPYKYQGRIELVGAMGRLMWEALHRFYDISAFDLILPVPLHWIRQYRRGFNQSALLIRSWDRLAHGRGSGINAVSISEKVLYRRRRTPSQTGLGREQRVANMENAFAVRREKQVRAKRVLLIDDVFTTGATTDACSRALRSAGATSVKVLTLARAV